MVKTRKRKPSDADAKMDDSKTEDTTGEEGSEEKTLTPQEQKLKFFIKYYKEINLVPENEWNAFMKCNLSPTPMSFRFLQTHRLCASNLDSIPGTSSQAEVLCEYMKGKHVEAVSKLNIEGKQVNLTALDWYPENLGWALNVPMMNMEKYLGLKEFDMFLNTEKNQTSLQKLETWSMFPPTLIDVMPYHRVLDMCASPGFIAGQLCESLHFDPAQANEGILILNDLFKLNDRMQYRWTQGSKVIFTSNDARTFPEIYLSSKHEAGQELRYDRIVCDVRCSNDGTMRKNVGIQEQWANKAALAYHAEQRAILRRALELLDKRGQVLYCTTSYNPAENEAVIMSLLKETEGTVELIDGRKMVKGNFKSRPGMSTWKIMTDDGQFYETYEETTDEFKKNYPESLFPPPIREATSYHMERCLRVMPHDNNSAGFFCAVLQRNSELPWVKAKRIKEAKEKEGEPDQKQYGYKIRLKCNVALSSIDWSTETTNQALETTKVATTESFEAPELEIDPGCKPQKLVSQFGVEEPFLFCETDTPQWIRIKKFFKISDDFDPTLMVMREGKTDFYMTSQLVKTVIQANKDRPEVNISVNLGVRFFHPLNRIWIPYSSPVNVLLSNQGFAYLHPYIEKQTVQVTKDDMLAMANNERLRVELLSEKAQEDIKQTDQGCILFTYTPENSDDVPSCSMMYAGVRGENYVTDYRDGKPNTEKRTLFRLCGMEVEDYRRKLQEDKLAKALEKEQKDKEQKEKEKKEKESKEDDALLEDSEADGEKMET